VLGVSVDRVYVDHGLTGTTRARPGLREALAACRTGDPSWSPSLTASHGRCPTLATSDVITLGAQTSSGFRCSWSSQPRAPQRPACRTTQAAPSGWRRSGGRAWLWLPACSSESTSPRLLRDGGGAHAGSCAGVAVRTWSAWTWDHEPAWTGAIRMATGRDKSGATNRPPQTEACKPHTDERPVAARRPGRASASSANASFNHRQGFAGRPRAQRTTRS